jgi:type VI secretion system protein ImpK
MDRIDEITKDCFNALIQIRQLDPQMQPPPEVLHSRMRSFIDTMIHRGGEVGFNREDMQDIAYAIVALCDELALSLPGSVRQYWMSRPLQLHYFNENVAGDGFFNRLEQIRLDTRRTEILRVYFLCLMFGFQGRYRIRGGEVELGAIIDTIQQDLGRARAFGSDVLSPHGDRPAEARSGTRREMPVVAASLVAVLLAIALYVGLRVTLGNETSGVVQRINTMNRQ